MRTSVPVEFDFPQDDFFDPQYMSALYEVGYQRALVGIAWQDGIGSNAAPVENEPKRDQHLSFGDAG